MASTYTGLGTQLMATGENAGTWGTKTNTNLNIIEQIAGGYIEVDVSSTPTTLSVSDGSTGAALAHRCITFTGEISENTVVTIPLDVQTFYIIKNSVSGSYSVQFKYVSGSGSSVTWASGDSGTKIIYATADDGTNPNIVDATSAFVTATSTTTLTNKTLTLPIIASISNSGTVTIPTGADTLVNLASAQTLSTKTLTAPKIVDGGFIADGGGDENLVFGEVGTPVNELKITNAATGSGPILSSVSTSATDTNIDINVTPAGTGNVNLSADAVQIGDNDANATLTTQGTGDLILNTNNGTNAGDITLLDGANGNIEFTNNGTGVVKFNDAAYYPEADLTFDASQDWDVQASPVAKVTLTANVTFDAPSNPTTGQFVSILCIQDGTGSRTIAWNAVFEFAAETAPTATTTADKADLFNFRYNGAKWLSVGTTLNLVVA